MSIFAKIYRFFFRKESDFIGNIEIVKFPGGKKEIVQELSVKQRNELSDMQGNEKDPYKLLAHVIKISCPTYRDAELDDIVDLPQSVFDKLHKAAFKVSALGEDANEEAIKNS